MALRKILPILLAFLILAPVPGAAISVIHSLLAPSAPAIPAALAEPLQKTQYFEVYSSSTQNLREIETGLSHSGIGGQIFGGLLQLAVPAELQDYVSGYLKSAQKSLGLVFFQDNSSLTSSPYITFTRSSQYSVIPYAYVPSQIASAYGFNPAYASGLTGSGITIGIVDAYGDPNLMYDLMAFDRINGLPAPNIQLSYPEGKPAVANSTWALETATDVEWAHAMAPNASIILYVTPSDSTADLMNAVSSMVSNGSANIISISWGNAEAQMTDAQAIGYNEVFQQAYQKGIMVFAASGDYGSYYYSSSGVSTLSVNFPASDPYVTAVGGSSLYLFDGKFNQTAWGEEYEGRSVGSGGGFSNFFSRPYWQAAPGFNSKNRGVPDVSMDANQYTGMVVVSGGAQYQVGGTSIATPIWAAIGAIIEQRYGKGLGNLDPLLYQISRTGLYGSSFTQITAGTNGYYSAGPGWNPVTGLGTPKVSGLVNATGKILKGFGGIAELYGNSSYADEIASELNFTLSLSSLRMNGTDFSFIGFRSGTGNGTEFGIAANYTGIYYELHLTQDGIYYAESSYLGRPTGSIFKVDGLSLSLTYKNGTITAMVNGNVVFSMQAFLANFGNMTPVLGLINYDSFQNTTSTGNASFYGTDAYYNGTVLSTSGIYYTTLSGAGSNYSSLGGSYSNGTVYFGQQLNETDRLINGSSAPEYTLGYHMTYTSPVLISLYINGYHGGVKWKVNGKNLSSGTFYSEYGGFYRINATIDAGGSVIKLARNISVPSLRKQNVTVSSGVPGYENPSASLLVDYFYGFSVHGNNVVTVMNGINVMRISSSGFQTEEVTDAQRGNLTVTLVPVPVRVSIFIFPAGSNVTFNGARYYSINGTYTALLQPGYVVINASMPGYESVSENVSLPPGINYTGQISLKPRSSHLTEIYGNVMDSIYSFPVPGANVSIGNSSYTFTNSSGFYILYMNNGTANITVNASLYQAVHESVVLKGITELNFSLKPLDINISSFPLIRITRYFPLLFFLGIVTWSGYTGNSFLEYQLYISSKPSFENPEILTFTSNTSTSTVISGIYPGHTYYATIVLRLSNGEVFQSQTVRMGYGNPVYLAVNIVIISGIAVYIFMTVSYLTGRRRKTSSDI